MYGVKYIVRIILTSCMVNMTSVVNPALRISNVLFWVIVHTEEVCPMKIGRAKGR